MANVSWTTPGSSGSWSSGPWTGLPTGEIYPGKSTSTDAVTLAGAALSYTVTDDVATANIAGLKFASPLLGMTTSLLISAGESLSVGGNVTLVPGAIVVGTGTLSAAGPISGSGTIQAGTGLTGGTLILNGAGSLSTSSPPVLAIDAGAPSTLELAFTGSVTVRPVTIINANQTLEIAGGTVTISGAQNVSSGTLRMAGGTLADKSGVTLGGSATYGVLSGFGTVTATLSRSGSGTANIVQATGGQLDLKGSVGSGVVLAIGSNAPANLKVEGTATASTPIAISSADQTLEIGSAGNLAINAAESIAAGTIQIDGGQLTASAGLVVGAGGTVIGSGTLAAPLSGSGSVIASGGTLHLTGAVATGLSLAIAKVAGSALSIENAATAAAPIVIGSVNQTLAIGPSGNLTIGGGAESIANGTISMTGGSLVDSAGVTIGMGAKLSGRGSGGAISLAGGTIAQAGGALNLDSIVGFGTVSGNPSVAGPVTASGGVLDLTGNLASNTTYQIGSAAGSVLELAGIAATGTNFNFTGSTGILELADVANGVVQNFNGTIAGLGIGNAINVQAPVTSASVSGKTITVANNTTIVAVINLSAAPSAGTATVVGDNKLGGYDVMLAPGSVINTAVSGPVVLSPGQDPLTITNTGTVSSTGAGADGIDAPSGTTWNITNAGEVTSSAAEGISLAGSADVINDGTISGITGVGLADGGSINNDSSGSISASGTIGSGWQVGAGIALTGTGGNVTNAGTIAGGGYGVSMAHGGSITNTGGIQGGEDGVVSGGASVNVSNSGRIVATVDDGMGLFAGGSVDNAAGALIQGAGGGGAGLFITGGGGTVANSGTITTSGTRFGVLLSGGGTVSNKMGGSISGGVAAVLINNASGTISNAGILTASGAAAADLEAGGRVDNLAGGVISAYQHGVFISAAASGAVTNAGRITSTQYAAVSVAAGSVTNAAGGSISGGTSGVFVGGGGAIENAGSINAGASGGAGVYLGNGGSATNDSGGIVSGAAFGVFTHGAAGTVVNNGSINGVHGLAFEAGGSLSNSSSGVISGQIVGVLAQGASASLDNFGVISANAAGGAGAELDAGGFVTNESGATLSGTAYGVFIGGGTVANAGTISGASYAVKFTGTNAANRLIVQPGAAFSGAIGGADSGNNTLEFANGTTGTLNGVSGGSGTATPTSGTAWSFFHNFSTIAVDAGANWTFNGSNTVSELTDNGTVGISGSLDLSSIDPTSTGVFALGGATLEVASALGTDEQMAFSANSDLTVDDTASFGINVGTGSYQGPTLQDFASGDSIDLKNFASAGATSSYDSSTGLLQIGNGTSHATLHFANATLGSGSFQVASDGGTGTSILLG